MACHPALRLLGPNGKERIYKAEPDRHRTPSQASEEGSTGDRIPAEFEIQNGDTSTTNYDAVVGAINLQDAPGGLLIHTAGFDHDAGVFRIFDVWETREQGEKFISERLNPIIEPMAAAAAQNPDSNLAPPEDERNVGTSCTTR